MKAILLFLIFLPIMSLSQLYGDNNIGIINDSDGYTFIRKGLGTNTEIKDTLFDREYFKYIPTDSTDWYQVFKMWNSNGFVHKSRIRNLKSLSRKKQYDLINSTFDKEISSYQKKINTNKGGFRNYHEEKFSPILDLFIHYSNKKYDDKLMRKFFDLLIIESGSADELPSTALGFIYNLNSKNIFNLIKEYDNLTILDNLYFGASFENSNTPNNLFLLKEQMIENQIDIISFKLKHSIRIPNYEVLIVISKEKNNTRIKVTSLPMFKKGWETTIIDTAFYIDNKYFTELSKKISKFTNVNLKKAKVNGKDGNSCKLTYGNSEWKSNLKFWTPDYNTEKRELTEFLNICKQIIKLGNLNPKEIL
jgi:hypothetical protein